MRLRHAVTAGLVTALVGSTVVVVTTGGPVAAPPAPVHEAPDAATAAVLAHTQGFPVEVLDQRTPTRAVFANPGGSTSAELSPVPVRVVKGGRWVPVDPTLERRADGALEPKAAVGGLVLSGGGDGAALATLRHEGREFAVRWPAPLPAPTLSGEAATYPEVLPGVDLVMRAERGGFRQHVVVKTAEAARAVAALPMAVESEGLRLRVDEHGAVLAVDAAGAAAFSAPPPMMWDAAGRSTRVGVAVTGGGLTLEPDRAFLGDPKTTYPVTIDPDWSPSGLHAWANVLSGKPGQSYWWTSGEHPWAQVGRCFENGYCNGIGEGWAYFQFDTGFLRGKDVLTASFDTSVVHSPNCVAKNHELHWSNGGIWNGMTWYSKPGLRHIATFGAPGANGNFGCGGWKSVGINILGNINGDGLSHYALKAADGTDQIAWRKYDPGSTRMRVTYNQAPHNPTDLRTDPSLSPPCTWCGGRSYVSNDAITLYGRLSDPDSDMLNALWRIKRDGVEELRGWTSSFQSSGAFHNTTVDLTQEHGKTIEWSLAAGDGRTGSGWSNGPGAFVVDRVGIPQKPAVQAKLYQQDNRWHGGVDVPDTFTFLPEESDRPEHADDIDHYVYGWQYPPTTPVAADKLGGSASVLLTPPGDGPQTLHVRSVDRAGHESPTQQHRVYVRAGNGPLAQYSFEGNADDSAFLGDRHGTLGAGASLTAQGAVGGGVQLNGGPGHVSAPNAVRTDTSFSVAAWVRLDELPTPGNAVTALSQDGANVSGFFLGYRNDGGGKWEFHTPVTDAVGTADEAVRAAMPVTRGTWTHVAAVYDAKAKQTRLYVNGGEVGTAARVNGFDARGALAIGRGKWGGLDTNHWPGAIDEAQVYDRVLSGSEIAAAVSTSGVQLAHWKFDDEEGTTARNAVAGGADAVLENGAAFNAEGAVAGGVRLDGLTGAVSAPGPVVRTDQSFSVSAQVKLDRHDGGTYTVLSQDGERFCGFCLQYQTGRWVFVFAGSDTDNPTAYYWVGTEAVAKDGFTHLVGTYDAVTRKIAFYVDGALVGETTRGTSWNAQRPFRIGRALISGANRQPLPGTIDEVRVYNRAVGPDEVQGILSRDDVTAGRWRLDGDATEADERHPEGTPRDGAVWVAGQTDIPSAHDLAVRLNGTGAHVSVPGVVKTDQSFSVTAWARLDRIGGHPAVVSQDGQTVSGFILRALPTGKWAFRAQNADVTNSTGGEAVSAGTAQTGVWTHLVGVYRKDRKQVELYVNGELAGSAAHTGGFHATGQMQIGRSKWNGASTDFFPGAVDDVIAYSRPLYAAEIKTMAGRDLSLGHNWTLDEGTGTTSGDAVGARQAALAGGAAFAPGRVGNSVRLDGVDDAVTTAGVDVRTDTSFTVSTWVHLQGNECDLSTTDRCLATAVSLDGGDGRASKFRLGHVVDTDGHSGNWVFEVPEVDGTVTEAAVAVRPGQLESWVHLVGVYDAAARSIWLYVDGEFKDDGTLIAPWQATGGLRIGHGQDITGPTARWRGMVDDVRLYAGALTDERVSALHASYPQPLGPDTLPVADAGHWKFDDNTGVTAADASGLGHAATLRGGAGWHNGRDLHAGWFDGTSGYAETDGPVVDTQAADGFSVAGWAYLTKTDGYVTVFGQDAERMSAFYVQFDPSAKKWGVVAPKEDRAGAEMAYLMSAEPAVVGWTHLAVVHDPIRSQLRLYVNGAQSGVLMGVSMLPSAGKFAMGRCLWDGAPACFFPRGVDDVRAFNRALSEGEVRRLHDDVPSVAVGHWRYDGGTAQDDSWVANAMTTTGPVSFPEGVLGKGIQLDGATSASVTAKPVLNARDSFTVGAWTKISRLDRVATVVGQDGDRQSGFVLQYRPDVGRWVFGASTLDADNAPVVYANSLHPPTVGRWTHVAGVYDLPARQLRIYVDGQLVGTRDNAQVWSANGGFTIGRAKVDGVATGHFPGVLDDVAADMGVVSAENLRIRAGYPAASGGQFARFLDAAGDHRSAWSTTDMWSAFGEPPAGYRFETSLGAMLPEARPGAHRLHSCLAGSDAFTSKDPACEGAVKLADLGWVYTEAPADAATLPVYRCRFGAERADSRAQNCEGGVSDGVLGHLLAYSPLVRYHHPRVGEHFVTTTQTPPGYKREGSLGLLARTAEPGTVELISCLDGVDQFLSTDPTCGGKSGAKGIGWLWSEPPAGRASRPLYLCALTGGTRPGQQFASASATCEGQTVRGLLGHTLSALPVPAAS